MLTIYVYECKCGNEFEKYLDRSEYDTTEYIKCSECGQSAKRIISNRGALRDEPTWLPSACELAVPDGERCPETRTEWKAYKKKHGFEEKCDQGPVLVSV